ncbi:ANTAR domain-containing protein [Cellulomonas sp. P5_C5]
MTATSTQVGSFRFGAATGRWWWSDHMFLIHGMQPGDVVPTRELLLTHVQREERAAVGDALDRCVGEGEPLACDYLLVDMTGALRRVVLAVAGEGDGDMTGFLVDVSPAYAALLAERVNAELTLALESHAAIDQAKGILMLTYGVDEDAAFGILKESSQRHNTRLRELARRVVEVAARGLESTTSELLDETLCGTSADQSPPPTSRRRHLDVSVERTAAGSVVRVSGAVDLSNRDELADALSVAMLGAGDLGRVTVDLRGVGRIGPAVVDLLTAALRRSAAHGIVLTIVGGGGPADASNPAAQRSSIASRS